MATIGPCRLGTCYLGLELRLCLVGMPHSTVPQGVVSTRISLLFPASLCHDTVHSWYLWLPSVWQPADIPSPCPSSFTAHNSFHLQTISISHLYWHPWPHWICLTNKSAIEHGQHTTEAYLLLTCPTAKSMSRKLHAILMCPVFLFSGLTLIFWLTVQQWCEAFLYVSLVWRGSLSTLWLLCSSKPVKRQPWPCSWPSISWGNRYWVLGQLHLVKAIVCLHTLAILFRNVIWFAW